jgi:hypothetical protein
MEPAAGIVELKNDWFFKLRDAIVQEVLVF